MMNSNDISYVNTMLFERVKTIMEPVSNIVGRDINGEVILLPPASYVTLDDLLTSEISNEMKISIDSCSIIDFSGVTNYTTLMGVRLDLTLIRALILVIVIECLENEEKEYHENSRMLFERVKRIPSFFGLTFNRWSMFLLRFYSFVKVVVRNSTTIPYFTVGGWQADLSLVVIEEYFDEEEK